MKKKCLRTARLVVFAIAVVSGIGWQSRSKHWRGSKSTSTNSSRTTKTITITSQLSNSAKIKALLNLLKKDPSSSLICNRLAYLYYSEKKYTNAEYYYKKAITYNSRNIEARLGLYLVNMVKKNYAQAATYCRQVKSIDNLNYYGNLYHAYARMAQYSYKSAEQTCKKMLAVYPTDKTFLRLLKLNYYYQKQTNKAKQIQTYLDMLR